MFLTGRERLSVVEVLQLIVPASHPRFVPFTTPFSSYYLAYTHIALHPHCNHGALSRHPKYDFAYCYEVRQPSPFSIDRPRHN